MPMMRELEWDEWLVMESRVGLEMKKNEELMMIQETWVSEGFEELQKYHWAEMLMA